MQGFTFFFFFNKQDCIKEKKAHKSTPVVYNELKKTNKNKKQGRKQKENSYPQEGPNQSIQSIKDKEFP